MRVSLLPSLFRFRLVALGAGVLALAGCSIPIPQAETDPTRYYVLSSSAVGATGAPSAGSVIIAPAGGATIHLSPVEVASYLRSRPIVVRRGDHEIEFREFARWGEALEVGIARVLREELLARGGVRAVQAGGASAARTEGDYALTVRVLAAEGAAGGAVIFRAAWELAAGGAEPKPVARGDFRATGLTWDGRSEAALAAQLSAAVAGLAAEISAAVGKK